MLVQAVPVRVPDGHELQIMHSRSDVAVGARVSYSFSAHRLWMVAVVAVAVVVVVTVAVVVVVFVGSVVVVVLVVTVLEVVAVLVVAVVALAHVRSVTK